MKRDDYISWDSAFISMAAIISFRSKDPSTQNGAIIVDKLNRIVSVGYNGFPRTIGTNDSEFPWTRPDKYNYVVHAEINAILNAKRDLSNCSIYLYSERGYYPCPQCAALIVNSGIKNVICGHIENEDISNSGTYDWSHTKLIFEKSDVNIRVLNNLKSVIGNVNDKLNKIMEKL